MGEFIALITAFIWALGIFPFTESAKRFGPLPVNNFRLLLAVVFLSVFMLIYDGTSFFEFFKKPTDTNWIYLGLSGIVGLAIGDYFSFASFAILGVRMGSIFGTLSPAFVFIIATLFTDEKLNLLGVFGIGITLIGIMVVILSKQEKYNFEEGDFGSYKKGILFGILSSLCQSIGIVLSKIGLANQDISSITPTHASWIRMLGATIAAYLVVSAMGKLKEISSPIIQNKNNGMKYVLLGTLCGPVIGMICSMYALSHVNASVAQTIFSLVPVFVLILNAIIYKEKISIRSMIGASIAILGVYILVFSDSIV